MADQNTPPSSAAPDVELLDRYLAGETNELETAQVRRYFMAHPQAASRIQRFLDGLEGADDRPAAPAPRRPFGPRSQRTNRPAKRNLQRYALVAAVVVGAIALGFGLPRAIVRQRSGAGVRLPRVYETAPRERAELLLSDGAHVRLAPASRLRIAADFGLDRRDVYLDGLAYFDVRHDARRPFTVFARNASALDMGTQFFVRAYAEDSAVQVVVRTGAVVLSGVGRLRAGETGQLARDGAARRWRGTSIDSVLAWLDGRLTYRDAPLGRVLQDIHRWYAVDARVDDPSLAALPFTGVLTEESSGAVIDRVAATLGLRVWRDSGGVVLAAIAGTTPHPRPSSRRRAGSPRASSVRKF